MIPKLKHFLLILLSFIPFANSFAQETQQALQKLPEAFQERVASARTHITSDWILKVADSLEMYSKEMDEEQYVLVASMLRSYYAFCKKDSLLFFENNNKALELSEKFKFYDRFFTEGTNRVSFYLNNNRYYPAMKYARFLLKNAKDKKHPMGIFSGFHALGNIYEKQGMFQMALSSFLEAEQALESVEGDVASYKKICREDIAFDYFYLDNYDEAEKICLELIKDDPIDIRGLGVLSAIYFKTGRFDKFKECKNVVDTVSISSLGSMAQAYDYIRTHMEILSLTLDGKTDEAIKMAESRSFIECMNRKRDIYIFTNRWKEAYDCQKLICAHYDSIVIDRCDNEINEMNAELDKLYQMNEKDGQINRLMYHVTIGFLLIAVIVIACIYFIRRNIIVTKSNKKLAEALDQMIEYKKIVMENMENKMTHVMNGDEEDVDEQAQISDNATGGKVKPTNTYEDVTQFIYELGSRKLFTNPDFDKNLLLAELNIHRSNFSTDFERQTGCSITKFILKLRMEHAAILIKDNPEYTLEAIASDSGISSRTTFYRNFTNYFGITPSAYRLEHLKDE